VPPQFTAPGRRPVRDLLATAPGQLRTFGSQLTQQARQYRVATFTPARPRRDRPPAAARAHDLLPEGRPRFFLRTILLVQVSFIAWIVTGLALAHAGQAGQGAGLADVGTAWLAIDVALGLGYGVYRLASHRYRAG
jgi:hypothetical protein